MRPVAMLVTATLLAGCSLFVAPQPRSVLAPAANETPAIDVNYRVSASCPAPIKVGNTVWVFDMNGRRWPPAEPKNGAIVMPYPVPGVFRRTSDTQAIFRADVNGAEFPLTRDNTAIPGGCL